MSHAGSTNPDATPTPRRYRWPLHLIVLILAAGAVLFAVRDRLTGGSSASDGGEPQQSAGLTAPTSEVEQTPTPAPEPSPSPSPAPAPTPELSPTPEPSPTPVPATPEPSPSPEPPPSPPPTPAPTPAPPPPPTPRPTAPPTPRPAAVIARAINVASLRTAPSTDALITGSVPAGSTATVVGCAGGCSWLLLATSGGTAWSARHFWGVTGDLSTIGGR